MTKVEGCIVMTNRRVNRRRSSFLLWSGMMQIIRVYDDSQCLLFSVDLFSFCEAEEGRSRSGRNGRRKIAIENCYRPSIDRWHSLSSSRLMPTGPSHPGNPKPSSIGRLQVGLTVHEGGCLFVETRMEAPIEWVPGIMNTRWGHGV
jgi:hypothetical protein